MLSVTLPDNGNVFEKYPLMFIGPVWKRSALKKKKNGL